MTYLDTHAVAALYHGDFSRFSPAALQILDASSAAVARKALEERWSRDPFDRLILAQARLHGARLVTKDRLLRSRYAHALG